MALALTFFRIRALTCFSAADFAFFIVKVTALTSASIGFWRRVVVAVALEQLGREADVALIEEVDVEGAALASVQDVRCNVKALRDEADETDDGLGDLVVR